MYGGQRFPYAQVSVCSLLHVSLNPHTCTNSCFLSRFKVSGELPLLHVKISDQKIQGVLELVDSIPLPQTTSTPPNTPTEKVRKHFKWKQTVYSSTVSLYWRDVLLHHTLNKSWLINGSFLVGCHRYLILLSLLLFFWKPWIFQASKSYCSVLIAFRVMW